MKTKLNVDFTGVQVTAERLPEGKHMVSIESAKFKEAQTKTQMLEIRFKGSDGKVAYTNITLLEQTLWKLKKFLEAVYQREFSGKIDMPISDLQGKRVGVEIVEETYVNKKNETKTRSSVEDFFPIPSNEEPVVEDYEDDEEDEEEEPAPEPKKKKKKKKPEPEPEEEDDEEEEEEEPKKKSKKAEQPKREKFPWEE